MLNNKCVLHLHEGPKSNGFYSDCGRRGDNHRRGGRVLRHETSRHDVHRCSPSVRDIHLDRNSAAHNLRNDLDNANHDLHDYFNYADDDVSRTAV